MRVTANRQTVCRSIELFGFQGKALSMERCTNRVSEVRATFLNIFKVASLAHKILGEPE